MRAHPWTVRGLVASRAIVGDGQSGAAPRTAQTDDDGTGVPVLDGIRDRLLGNPIEVATALLGTRTGATIKAASDLEELPEFVSSRSADMSP
jgi:hypothetical protein